MSNPNNNQIDKREFLDYEGLARFLSNLRQNSGLVLANPDPDAPDQTTATIKDIDNKDIVVPARSMYLKGFTKKTPTPVNAIVTRGKFFIKDK